MQTIITVITSFINAHLLQDFPSLTIRSTVINPTTHTSTAHTREETYNTYSKFWMSLIGLALTTWPPVQRRKLRQSHCLNF